MRSLHRLGPPIVFVAALLFASAATVHAQSAPPLDISAYRDYFLQHQEMTAADLLNEYDAGLFRRIAPADFHAAAYSSEFQSLFDFTPDEIDLVEEHGFAVSGRLSYPSFGHAFVEVFINDLPVYFSSDAVLHAIHLSYDHILQDVEREILIPRLTAALISMHDALPALADDYASAPEMSTMLHDVDVYLTVPMKLLGLEVAPFYPANVSLVDTLLSYVADEKPLAIPLFSETPRYIDFSQFTPRGHYTDDEELRRYFQAMIWIGRTELYLIAPKNTTNPPTDEDVRRQIVMTKLISELATVPPALSAIEDIDVLIRTLVGDSDNVTLENVRTVFDEAGIDQADQLLEDSVWKDFQQRLAEKPFAFQKILSQILIQDVSPEPVEFASSFLLLGQRFVIDSYVTGSVVYDRIPSMRLMPSTLDVLFALGNDGAAQFLQQELDLYDYAPNLAALRYLIDSYDDSFWSRSLYNGWLNAIRQLSPPTEREDLPPFMQTAHWWQKEMTSQLASWAQLRHDNLLYAKQSYTTGIICSFPETLVEAVPRFFEAVRSFSASAASSLERVLPAGTAIRADIVGYFSNAASTMTSLRDIAQKEIDGEPASADDRVFLGDMLIEMQTYANDQYKGWYPNLFYRDYKSASGDASSGSLFEEDLVVADVHTQTTDAAGTLVGKVLHAGTGPVNMAIIVAKLPGGEETTFVGPVMSYYEHVTMDFKRLTDEEWKTMYDVAPSIRPEFANPYLADGKGVAMPGGLLLTTGVENEPEIPNETAGALLAPNYPNPFREETLLRFRVPAERTLQTVDVTIYNINGQIVRRLVNEALTPGAYSIHWNGLTDAGVRAPSGMYAVTLEIGGRREQRLVTLVR